MSTMKLTYREAVRAALRDALATDERVFLMGEDVGGYGGAFAVSLGLLDEFGPERVRNTPLSESAFVGAGIGAALGGMSCAASHRLPLVAFSHRAQWDKAPVMRVPRHDPAWY